MSAPDRAGAGLDGTVARLRALFIRHATGTDAAHDTGHMDRVWAMARRLARAEAPGCDLPVLAGGAYLHDIVILPKNAPNRSAASWFAAAKATELLTAEGWPAARIEAVAHAVEAHSFSGGVTPRTVEARLLRDADRLESLGAIGLARVFATSGALGRGLLDQADPLATRRERDETAWALDHIRTKFARLPDGMSTATGRKLARTRLAFAETYVEQLLAEANGDNESGLTASSHPAPG